MKLDFVKDRDRDCAVALVMMSDCAAKGVHASFFRGKTKTRRVTSILGHLVYRGWARFHPASQRNESRWSLTGEGRSMASLWKKLGLDPGGDVAT